MRRTRILVADPLRIFRAGVRNLLARESDFEVIEAGTLDEVLAAVEHDCPDVALIDLELPPLGGVAAVASTLRMSQASTVASAPPQFGSIASTGPSSVPSFPKAGKDISRLNADRRRLTIWADLMPS